MLLALKHARRHLVCSFPQHLFLPFDLIVFLEKDHFAHCYISSPHIRQDSGTSLVRTDTLSIPYTTTILVCYLLTRILIFPLVLVSFSRRRYMSYS